MDLWSERPNLLLQLGDPSGLVYSVQTVHWLEIIFKQLAVIVENAWLQYCVFKMCME